MIVSCCEDLYPDDGEVVRVVDARNLRTAREHRAQGHLGPHPWNMAAILANPAYATWRAQQYIKLYSCLLDERMLVGESEARGSADDPGAVKRKAMAVFCEKGSHRSMSWSHFEACILIAMGFNVNINPVCVKHQMYHCANPNKAPCRFCTFENPDVKAIMCAGVDEFFEVMCAAEQHWPVRT